MAMECDPCDCPEQYYRDNESFKKAVIVLLCNLIEATEVPETPTLPT
jgi:hypothetical protein